MNKRGFATLTITLMISIISVIAVFYLGKDIFIETKKTQDEILHYEAYNAAHSGMMYTLKTITENSSRLPCLKGSEEINKNGTFNSNCFCTTSKLSASESKATCSGIATFSHADFNFSSQVEHNELGFFSIQSEGVSGSFKSIVKNIYHKSGGMKKIPRSAIVSTGDVRVVGNTYFDVANESKNGGSIETGGKLYFDSHQGSKRPVYDWVQISSGNKVNVNSTPKAVDDSDGFNQNTNITDNNKASSEYLGKEFMDSKGKFLDIKTVQPDASKQCQSMISQMKNAKANGKLENHVWLDLNGSSIHEFKVFPYIGMSDPSVWGCYLDGPLVYTDKPMNIVINLTGLPDKDSTAYKYIMANGLTIYTNGGGPARGMISFIDSVKNSKVNLKFQAMNTVQLVGTLVLDSESLAWFESSFKLTYDSKLLNEMNDKLKSQSIKIGAWSDY